MSARLIASMEAERARLASVVGGFTMTGERDLARAGIAAARQLRLAVNAMIEFEAAQGEARERAREA